MTDFEDDFELRAQLREVEQLALETAERLALRVLDRPSSDALAVNLARQVASQARLAHRLRHVLNVAVAG